MTWSEFWGIGRRSEQSSAGFCWPPQAVHYGRVSISTVLRSGLEAVRKRYARYLSSVPNAWHQISANQLVHYVVQIPLTHVFQDAP